MVIGHASPLAGQQSSVIAFVDVSKAIASIAETHGDELANETLEYLRLVITKKMSINEVKKVAFGMAAQSKYGEAVYKLFRDAVDVQRGGKLYEVELAPTQDEYLDWNKPLSEQSEKVKSVLSLIKDENAAYLMNHSTGESLYLLVAAIKAAEKRGGDVLDYLTRSQEGIGRKSASEYLRSLGIRGIRYQADNGNSPASNYVVFDDNDISITNKYSADMKGAEGLYNRKTDTMYLFASNLTKDTLPRVLAHELFHRALAIDPHLKTVMARFEVGFQRSFDEASKGVGSPAEISAYHRVIAAETPLKNHLEEFKAYLVSQYVKTPNSFTGKIKKLFAHFMSSVRVALLRTGLDAGSIQTLNSADLFVMSGYGAKTQKTAPLSDFDLGNIEVMTSAKAQGYKGGDPAESIEWLRAKSKGLDMSQAARMERAEAMGFDVNTVFYHGTPDSQAIWENGFTKTIGPSYNKDIKPAFFTSNKKMADGYAFDSGRNGGSQEVICVFLKKEQTLNLDWHGGKFTDDGRSVFREYSKARDMGFDSVSIDNIRDSYDSGVGIEPSNITIIFNPKNIRSIDSAFDTDFENSVNLLASAKADRFYSALRRAFIGAPDKVFGNPLQLKSWLAGNSARLEIKKDEIFWSGINEWLDMQTSKVSRDAVLDYLGNGGVQVIDVMLGETDVDEAEIQEFLDDESGEGYTREEARDYLRNDEAHADTDTKHGDGNLVIPGGTDYRELIITIPTIEKWQENDDVHFGGVSKGKAIGWLRMNTRADADGNSTLFLEEVQSQRVQAGRSQGFSKGRLKTLPEDYGIEFYKDIEKYVVIKPSGDRLLSENGFSITSTTIEGAEKQALLALNGKGVPPAPFVADSNNKASNAYITLLFKKAITYAINNGQDSVSWTTGDQQADRYDLSKQVEGITAWEKEGLYTINVELKGNQQSTKYENQTPAQLEEIIGKDLTQKIVNKEGEKLPRSNARMTLKYYYSGEKLKIGGGWTQAMYGDENGLDPQGKPAMLMQAAMDIARKMGGEIGNIELPTESTRSKVTVKYDPSNMAWDARNNSDIIRSFTSRIEAAEFADELNDKVAGIRQPALIITDAMKNKIMDEGMPLFSKNSADKAAPVKLTNKLTLLDSRYDSFNLKDIKNRRFAYNPKTKELVLGREGVVSKAGLQGSHAEEVHDSGAIGKFDDFYRGWVGVSKKDYPNGIIHFSPAVTKTMLQDTKVYDEFFDTLDVFRNNGANDKTSLRNAGNLGETKLGGDNSEDQSGIEQRMA